MGAKGFIAGAALLAAGGVALALSGGGSKDVGSLDAGVVDEQIEAEEADLAPRAVRSGGGRLVRVVGCRGEQAGAVEDTAVGRVVEVDGVDENVRCHVVVDAMPKPYSEVFPDGSEYVRNIPDIPEIGAEDFHRASWPVMISGSCNQAGSCMWSWLLRGDACLKIADLDYYVGSTMQEFLALDQGQQERFLRTRGTCVSEEGETSCTVSVGDPRADPDAAVVLPHKWAGRDDLNYVRGVGGPGEKKAEARYVLPEQAHAELHGLDGGR